MFINIFATVAYVFIGAKEYLIIAYVMFIFFDLYTNYKKCKEEKPNPYLEKRWKKYLEGTLTHDD